MRRQIFKAGFLTLALCLGGIAQVLYAQEEVSKTYHKEYSAGPETILAISNKYGDINFENWDKNSLVIDVKITVDVPDRERAERLLDYLDVEFSQSGNRIEAVTRIDDRFSRSGWTRWGKDGKRFSIDYTVQGPAAINAELMNKYGNTFVSELSGHAELTVKYGNLKVNKLSRGDQKPLNYVVIGYGNGSIDEANWLKTQVKYGKLEIETVRALAGETAYSKINIDRVSSMVVESKYDKFNLGTVKNLILDIAYGDVKADKVTGKISFDSRYTGIKIDQIPAGFESIKINNKYGGISLGIEDNASYDLKAEGRYCKIAVPESSGLSRIIENTSSTYSGTVGNKTQPKSSVRIYSSYGNVKLIK